MRAAAIAGWLLAAAFAFLHLQFELPFVAIAAVIGGWASAAGASWFWLNHREEISDRLFFGQLLFDVGALGALLYMTGGATNPLTFLLLLPLIISAALLPGRYSWVIALAVIGCYTLLLYAFIPLPLYAHGGIEEEFDLHVFGMWLGFMLSAGLIASFVARMGSSLRERDRVLAHAKQRRLRDERIVALGALAAGAAHELGTPLGTIALVAEAIEHEHGNADRNLIEKVGVLKDQVARCKETLAMLSASAGQSQAAAGRRLAINQYLEQVLRQWRSMRPGVDILADFDGDSPAPVIIAEQTLTQALFTVFNNAADASPTVEITARWSSSRLMLEVRDYGEGVTAEAVSAAGVRVFSTKEPHEGLGLGLYLAYSIIHGLGGEVRLLNRPSGGACTEVSVPLDGLRVSVEPKVVNTYGGHTLTAG